MTKGILKNKYFKDGGLYLFGNLFNKAIAFITVPIFTRILSTSEYGIVSTYSSLVSILTVVVGLSLGNSIRNAFIDFKDDLQKFISSIFSLSFISFILITLLAVGINQKLHYISETLIILCCIQAFAAYIIQSMVIKYMMEGEAKKRTFLLVFPNMFAAILSVIFILNMDTNKEYGRIIPMFFVTSTVGFFFFFTNIFKGKTVYSGKYWKYALPISIPLIFHGLSINILNTSDRRMLTAFRSTSETGIYSVVYNIGLLATVVTTSLESVWIPYFTKKMVENNKHDINSAAKVYIELCTIVFCFLLVIAPETLTIFASSKYNSGIPILAPVILASYFQYLYTFAVNTEYYYRKTNIIAINTFIAAGINMALNFLFIPKFGAIAAATTTVVAYIISFLIHHRYCQKLDSGLFPLKIFAIPTAIMAVITIFQYATLSNIIIRWIGGIIIIFAYFIFIMAKENTILKRIIGKN